MTDQIPICLDMNPISFLLCPSKSYHARTECPTKTQPSLPVTLAVFLFQEARTGRKIVSKKEQDQARDKKKKAEYEYESVTARDKEMATQVLEYNVREGGGEGGGGREGGEGEGRGGRALGMQRKTIIIVL